jgi:hypothetical protein
MTKGVLKRIGIPLFLGVLHFLFSSELTRSFYLFFGGMIILGTLIAMGLVVFGKTDYLGASYFGFFGLKLTLFVIIYYQQLEGLSNKNNLERMELLIPLVLSLFIEALGLSSILLDKELDKPNKNN